MVLATRGLLTEAKWLEGNQLTFLKAVGFLAADRGGADESLARPSCYCVCPDTFSTETGVPGCQCLVCTVGPIHPQCDPIAFTDSM